MNWIKVKTKISNNKNCKRRHCTHLDTLRSLPKAFNRPICLSKNNKFIHIACVLESCNLSLISRNITPLTTHQRHKDQHKLLSTNQSQNIPQTAVWYLVSWVWYKVPLNISQACNCTIMSKWYMVSNVRSLCEEGEYGRDQLWKVAKDSYHSSSAHHLRKLFLLNRLLLPRANQLDWLFNFQIHDSTTQIFFNCCYMNSVTIL